MPYETLRVRAEPDVLWITLSRPERQNSIDGAVLAELHAALDQAERSDGCRMVVLEGSAGVFCTGMDLTSVSRDGGGAPDLAARGGEAFFALLERLTTVPRAVVARVDGRVTGGGVGIAAASDFVYASPRSVFSLPEALWGLLPCCVLPFLVRRVGFQPAYAMALSTLPVSAEQARQMHLADDVAEDTDTLVRRLRARLTKLDAATVGDLKRYARGLWFSSAQMERPAVAEFARLVSSPVVRDRIAGFATHKVFPWESRR